MAAENRRATRTGEEKFSYVDARTVKDEAHLYVGEMVQADDSTGEVEPATDAAAKTVLGVNTKEVDNAADGETANFIATSVLQMDNAGDIDKTNIGAQCYVLDAATVTITGSSNFNVAGIVAEVTDDGVFVDFDPAKKA